jgi:hypothetical protein
VNIVKAIQQAAGELRAAEQAPDAEPAAVTA